VIRTGAAALLALLLAGPAPAVAQSDTTSAASGPTPGGALRRSLIVPGWGQLHVGRPARAVVAAGAVGGLVTAVVLTNGRYVRLRHAYLYVSREDADPTTPDSTNEFVRYQQQWLDAGAPTAADARRQRDGARRTRDLAAVGSALVYVLQALDAYVAAHLLDFDVSEDLSLRAAPAPGGVAATLTVRL